MLKTIIKKDISLMLKDLKIQIYCSIILILFIMSSFTFVSELKKEQKKFQNEINTQFQLNEQYTNNMMRFISEGRLNYFQKPSKEAIVVNKTGFPTHITSSPTAFIPKIVTLKPHPKNNISLSWLFIIGIIESFSALLFSYNAISMEKLNGTFRLQLINNVSRISVFLSKYLGLLLFFTFLNIIGMTVSSSLIYLLLGTFFSQIATGGIALMVLSIPFISFFILSGLLISMSKDYRSNIVVALSFWLLFSFIIPQLPFLLADKIYKLQNQNEFVKEYQKKMWNKFDKWSKKYDDEKTGQFKVGGNGFLKEGYRSGAYYEMSQVKGKLYKKRILDSIRQINLINKILMISPYSILENSLCKIMELGVYKLDKEVSQFEEFQAEIEAKLKRIDSENPKSLHLFYNGAWSDRNVLTDNLVPFSDKPYPNPNELILTKFSKDSLTNKINKSLINILILIVFNLVTLSVSILKIRQFDVR